MNFFEEYRITSDYGNRIHPISGKPSFHTGVDLFKEHNSPIYTFTSGLVLFSGEGIKGSGFGGYGNVVAIQDEDGHLHCYCHLSSTGVKTGAKIEKGQVIGRQGDTGNVTGSHLHYEVRKASSPSYGWVEDATQRCFEPKEYLKNYYEKYYTPKVSYKLTEKDANNIIAYLQAGWAITERHPEARKEFELLADKIRVAAGMMPQNKEVK